MINRAAIEEFVTEATKAIETDPQMNEAMTRKAILDSFCDLLGWDFPRVAKVEHPVKAFGRQFEVDYAYLDDGTEKAFIEAKGVDTPLTEQPREQLKAYLKNGDAKVGILTNGKQYEFYRRVTMPEIRVKQAIALELEELPDHPRVLQEFTHDSLNEGGDDVIDIVQERELYETLQTEKAEIAEEVEQSLIDHTKEEISGGEFRPSIRSHIDTAAKSAVDTLASRVEPNGHDESENNEKAEKDSQDIDETEDYIVKLQDKENTLSTFSGELQTEPMAEAVSYLIENHDLISKIGPLPYIPGREKAIINEQPTSPHDEEAMRNYRELSGGYYLDTHMGAPRKKKYLRKFASECQVEVTVEGGW